MLFCVSVHFPEQMPGTRNILDTCWDVFVPEQGPPHVLSRDDHEANEACEEDKGRAIYQAPWAKPYMPTPPLSQARGTVPLVGTHVQRGL